MEIQMTKTPSLPHAADPHAMAARLMSRAHNRDGLPEIAVGFIFLLASGLNYAQAVLPRGSIGFNAAVLVLPLLLTLMIVGSPWALKRVRRRYLIARVGYVEPKPMDRRQIGIGVGLAVLVAAGLFGGVPRLSQPDRWLLAGTGLFGGSLVALCGRLPRFVVGGVAMAVTGVWVAFSGLPLMAGFTILFGVSGLMACISGGVVFLRFIRQPAEAGQ